MTSALSLFHKVSTLALTSLGLAIATANASEINVLVSPAEKTRSTDAAAQLRQAAGHRLVSRSSAVFSAGEANALAQLGEKEISQTLRLEFSTQSALEDFRRWAARSAPALKIDENPEVRLTDLKSAEPLAIEQWAIQNGGGTYPIDMGNLTTLDVPAIAGEDIGLTRILKAPAQTGKTIRVAVLDSGIALTHPDLKAAIDSSPAECEALKKYEACLKSKTPKDQCEAQFSKNDPNGNGYALDCNGWNFSELNSSFGGILGNSDVNDRNGHGTHVAGVIAAQLNGVGIAGVVPNVKILPVKVISGSPADPVRPQSADATAPETPPSPTLPREQDIALEKTFGDVIVRGILYAIRSKADVISMSLGWPELRDSRILRKIVQLAQKQGIVVVAAAGNDSTDSLILPCRYEGVICVAAHGPDGALTYFSNYGTGADIAAPGINILSTWPTAVRAKRYTDQPGYDFKNGTSMATPYVSAAVAYLLERGFRPDEVYARLMLGSRPMRESQVDNESVRGNRILGGNLDIAKALEVEPQALILPYTKDPVRIEWDRRATHSRVEFQLKNYWRDGKNVRVTITPSRDSLGFRFSENRWTIDRWESGDALALSTDLEIVDARLDSDLRFDVKVSAEGLPDREFHLQAEIVVPIGVDTPAVAGDPGREIQVLTLDGLTLTPDAQVIGVLSETGQALREYAVVSSTQKVRTLRLLTRGENSKLVVQGSLELPNDGTILDRLMKVRLRSGADPSYIAVELLPAEKGMTRGSTQVRYLDSKLQPVPGFPAQTISIKTTYLHDHFMWQDLGDRRALTWLSTGSYPEKDQPRFDPWNPVLDPQSQVSRKLYLLAPEGLRSIEAPENYSVLTLLHPTPEQRERGAVPVLLAKGEDYKSEYAISELVGKKWGVLRDLKLSRFRQLMGILPQGVHSLRNEGGIVASSFSMIGARSTQRTTWLNADPSKTDAILDFTARAERQMDAVAAVAGSFLGERRGGIFALTKYRVQYHEFAKPSVASTSLKKFSFLPTEATENSVFPLTIEDRHAPFETRVPALLVPSGFGFSWSNQVIVPQFDSDGSATRLVRPARFRLEPASGCDSLPKPKDADKNGPAEIVFYCADRFIYVPLKY